MCVIIGSSNFVASFDNDSTDRTLVIKRALAAGFSVVLNDPNMVTPLCPLTAKNRRIADEEAGAAFREAGLITKAEAAKHECGIAHALTPEDSGRVSGLMNRIGNTVNLGVHLGLSGFVVVNVDNDEQRAEFLQTWEKYSDQEIALPTIKTPGYKAIVQGQEVWKHKNGAHWWFKVPAGSPLPEHISKYVTSQGWSILWGNSQAIVPPSRKPEGNYVLQNTPGDLPEWLFNLIVQVGKNAETNAILDVDVVGAGEKSPFSRSAVLYREHGWNPLPLYRDGDRYKPFRKGHTGRTGKDLTSEQIERYSSSAFDLGVALRMPRRIIAIDVDGHDGKVGDSALFNLEYTLGSLPSTYRNTARTEDDVAGHRFFTIPEGVVLMDKIPNKNIDILQYHHRYANVWPTLNAKTGKPYRWYSQEGELMPEGFIPDTTDLPELPTAWISHLTKKLDDRKPGRKIDPEDMDDTMILTGREIVERSVNKLIYAPPGTRNNQLNTTSFLLGRMVAADVISIEEAENMVIRACDINGLSMENQNEVSATFNSGMNAGVNDPWTPEGLEFVDPEEIVTDEHKSDELLAVVQTIKANMKPTIMDIPQAASDIIKVCKENGFNKGQTVTWLFGWSRQAELPYNADQISLALEKVWELSGKSRLTAKPARRILVRPKFLWEGRIPLGGLTFLAGEGEAGKTTFVAWIIANLTNGTLPGSLQGTPRHVLYVRPEGSWSEVQTQFEIAEANLDLIHEIVLEVPGGMDRPPTLPDDIEGFEELCEAYDPALIIFDPLPARMNERLSSSQDADVRRALEPLTYMAQNRQLAVIGIHHFGKDNEKDVKNRMLGSVAFVNLSRSSLMVAYSPETGERYLGVIKSNVADKTKVPTIKFKIVSDSFMGETEEGMETINGTRIEIEGTDSRHIDQIMYQLEAKSKNMRGRERSEQEATTA